MKATKFEALIAATFLTLGAISTLTESATPEQGSSIQNIQNAIGKFNKLFVKLINDDLKNEENAIFSPLNIYTALSLLNLGTSGNTRTELSKDLGMPADEAGFAAIHSQLSEILRDLQTTRNAEVSVSNSIFVQKDLRLKKNYSKAMKNYYDNEVMQVDFSRGSEATNIVNNWVSNNTKNRIPKLFQSNLPSETKLLLASVLFFNATWNVPFIKKFTTVDKFYTGVRTILVPMMNDEDDIPYIKDENLQFEAISLSYKRNEFNMVVILPYQNNSLKALADNLKPEHLQQTIKEISSGSRANERVRYALPRFKFGWSQSIKKHLIESGIEKIFGKAQLGNMIENTANFTVDDINHAAEIEVNEVGTVASAVSIGRVIPLSLPPEPVEFYVNRPFLFTIYRQETGIILFTGIVQNPMAA